MNAYRHFLFLATLGVASVAPENSRAEVFTQAEITQIFNEVKTLDATGAHPSKIRETIQGVQSIKTGGQSRAELTFPDKSLTRLGGNTIFSFQQGTRELELKQGTILFEVPKGNGGAKIRTAAITAAITGTTGFYEYSPNAGADGIIKFGILEGSATLFIKGRLGHFITVEAGQMVICPAKLRDFNSTEVVYFEIGPFVKTCALINRMGGLPGPSLLLVDRAIAQQGTLFNRSKELFLTNLFIPGGGTEVVLTNINQRFTANNPLATPVPTPTPAPTIIPAGSTPNPSSFGPLHTITSPSTYVINSTTQVQTDPTITTNGAANSGSIYRGQSQDGLLTNFLFGSTTTFDQQNGLNAVAVPSSGIAAFKFDNLQITGAPQIDTTNGPTQLALIAEGSITTGAPGGTFNLNNLDGLLLGTVNGSITSGSQLSYVRTKTTDFYLELYARGASSDITFNSTVNFAAGELDLAAEHDIAVNSRVNVPTVQVSANHNFTLGQSGQLLAAAGTGILANNDITINGLISSPAVLISSGHDFTLGSSGQITAPSTVALSANNNVTLNGLISSPITQIVSGGSFTLGTGAQIVASTSAAMASGGDFIVNGSISSPVVQIITPNNFTLGPSAQILAPTNVFIVANSVSGSPTSLISTPNLTVGINGSGILSQSQGGSVLSFNSVPIDRAAIQNLTLSAESLTIASDIAPPNLLSLNVTSTTSPLTINGVVTAGTFIGTGTDLAGTGTINAANVSLTLTSGAATVNQSDLLTVQSVGIRQNNLTSLAITAPTIQLPLGMSLNSSVSLTLTGTINSSLGISAGNVALLGNATVQDSVSATKNLTIQNLTVNGSDGFGQVNANTISRGFLDDTPHTLSPGFISAPGGLLFDGVNGSATTAPGNGGILTINAPSVTFDTVSKSESFAQFQSFSSGPSVIGPGHFNGGDALPDSGFAGGNGGNLTINASSITVNQPITATTGINSTAVAYGGAGGTVNLTSTDSEGQINIGATIDVSSNTVSARRVSKSGGNINVSSSALSGTAINVTNSGALRSLLNAAAPGPGGTIQIVSAGGNILFNGTAIADRGTVDMHINSTATAGTIALTNATISADVVKIGALGANGQLNIGGGSINANSLLKLYAGGSNGTVTFISNTTLSGGTKIIAANTVTINSGTTVTVNGSTASVYANTRNFVGGNSSTPAPGRFAGPGAPTAASTHSFSGAPGF